MRNGENLAEREGFEPPIPVKVCLISSQVHSTALPPLRPFVINELARFDFLRFVHCGAKYGAFISSVHQFTNFRDIVVLVFAALC